MATSDSICADKRCTRCGETKPEDQFAKEGDRRRNQCHACRASMQRDRRRKAPPERKAKHAAACREYARAHPEAITANRKRYFEQNRERLSQAGKDRYRNDLEFQAEVKRRAIAWRKANRERKQQANREWNAENRERSNELFRRSKAKRRQNPTFRLYASISTQMRLAIKDRKAGRTWESIVGYSIGDLVPHIEKQFLKGMTWENYGPVWHVDHIVPQVTFELADADDATVRACWALSNLRPLWAVPNLSKGARRTHLV